MVFVKAAHRTLPMRQFVRRMVRSRSLLCIAAFLFTATALCTLFVIFAANSHPSVAMPHTITEAVLFHNEDLIACASASSDVYIVHRTNRSLDRAIHTNLESIGPVAVSPDDKAICVARATPWMPGTIELLRIADGAVMWTVNGHGGAVSDVAYLSPHIIAAAGHDGRSDWGFGGSIRLVAAETGALVREIGPFDDMPVELATDQNGSVLCARFNHGGVEVWACGVSRDAAEVRPVVSIQAGECTAIAVTTDGSTCAVANGPVIRLLQLPAGTDLARVATDAASVNDVIFLSGHSDTLIYSDEGEIVALRSMSGKWKEVVRWGVNGRSGIRVIGDAEQAIAYTDRRLQFYSLRQLAISQ
jgi:WD40 repeat protein